MRAWVLWLFVVTAMLVGVPSVLVPIAMAALPPVAQVESTSRGDAREADMLALGVLVLAVALARAPKPRPPKPTLNPDEPIPYRLSPKAIPVPYWPAPPPEMAGAA